MASRHTWRDIHRSCSCRQTQDNTQMNDELRVAIVGLGKRAINAWLPALQRFRGFRITAICDPIVACHERARAQLKNSGEVKACTRYEDVLADGNVDAVVLTVRCPEQGAMAA